MCKLTASPGASGASIVSQALADAGVGLVISASLPTAHANGARAFDDAPTNEAAGGVLRGANRTLIC